MARLHYNGVSTTLGGSLTNVATSVTFAAALTHSAGTQVPTVASPDFMPLTILDSSGVLSEVVYLTAYTAGATTGTITRAQEGTTAVAHSSGDKVVHSALAADFTTTLLPSLLGYASKTSTIDESANNGGTGIADVDPALAVTFTAPASGRIRVQLSGLGAHNAASQARYWYIREGTTILAQTWIRSDAGSTRDTAVLEVSGLTPGSTHTIKWSHAVGGTGGIAYVFFGPTYGTAIMEVYDTALSPLASQPASSYKASVYKTADQTVNNQVVTTMTWDGEAYDPLGMHDNATNNSRITIPAGGDGDYLVTSAVSSTAGPGQLQMRLYKNGALYRLTVGPGGNSGGSGADGYVAEVVPLVAGDYVEIAIYQASGFGASVTSGQAGGSYFQVTKLGGLSAAGDTAWHMIGGSGEPAYQNGATNTATPVGFRKDASGVVRFKGSFNITGTGTAFTLPAGYRPGADGQYVIASNGAYGQVQITTGGLLSVSIPAGGSSTNVPWLSSVSFLAEQ